MRQLGIGEPGWAVYDNGANSNTGSVPVPRIKPDTTQPNQFNWGGDNVIATGQIQINWLAILGVAAVAYVAVRSFQKISN